MTRDDIPQVASLYEAVIRSGSHVPAPKLADAFERTFCDSPFVDADIPSLVYEDDTGAIAGFIGSHPRRLRMDGRVIRVACSGQLITEPKVRTRAAGALLMRAYMAGPQEVTITDGATEEVRRIWEGLGGQVSSLGCLEWIRVFRPLSGVCDLLARRRSFRAVVAACRPVAAGLDALAMWPARSPFRTTPPATIAEPLTPMSLAEHLPIVGRSYRIQPAYDAESLAWLFAEMKSVTSRGTLVAMLVRSESRKVLGSYVYYLRSGGVSEVIHLAAAPRDVDAVLDHLFHHARTSGAAAVRGRLERRLLDTLARRRFVFRYCGMALVHARDPEMLGAVQLDHTLLTRMDGEWWMGQHIEPFA